MSYINGTAGFVYFLTQNQSHGKSTFFLDLGDFFSRILKDLA